MGYLLNKKCYLVGPIEHDKMFGMDWRKVACEELNKINITIYNPLDRPEWMKHIEPYVPPFISRHEILLKIEDNHEEKDKYIAAQKFVRHICARYVHSCDFVLCYLPNAKTFGSTEELVIANQAKKPILMICPDNIPSLWIYDLVVDQPIFSNLKLALEFINKIDKGEEELDLLKWIFMTDYPKLKLEKQYDW